MAESVDALVSNTNGCKAVPVRPRLWVLEALLKYQEGFIFWCLNSNFIILKLDIMSVQYLSDEKGEITAVQVSIKEWEMIKSKYPDVMSIDTVLPQWQKDIIDSRLKDINDNPNKIRPISELLNELDN
jgi:hypothetical protein